MSIKAQVQLDGTETEKRLAHMLFDEQVHVLSTFELNQIASLTYGDESCDQIFEMITNCLRLPLDFSVLTLQKCLVITHHVLIYGSEKCVNSAWGVGRSVEVLQEFNTVLWQQERKTVGTWWNQIKGGSVDKGFPVREAAQKLHAVLQDKNEIQRLRHDKADPNSLVPVGDDKVGFVSDKVRLLMLRRRMEEQQLRRTKSNLAKASGGYGGGYNSKDGKVVVGAAHSMDEMLARAAREKKKFSDTGPVHYRASQPPQTTTTRTTRTTTPATADLLDFDPTPAPAPAVDLLDFGATPSVQTPPAAPVLDIFSPNPTVPSSGDLLAQPTTNGTSQDYLMQPKATNNGGVGATSDLLSMMTVSSDATTTTTTTTVPPPLSENTLNGIVATEPAKKSVMSSNVDRFSALDALAPPEATKPNSILAGVEAQNRILSFTSTTPTQPPMTSSSMGGGLSAPPSLEPNHPLGGQTTLSMNDGSALGGPMGGGVQEQQPPGMDNTSALGDTMGGFGGATPLGAQSMGESSVMGGGAMGGSGAMGGFGGATPLGAQSMGESSVMGGGAMGGGAMGGFGGATPLGAQSMGESSVMGGGAMGGGAMGGFGAQSMGESSVMGGGAMGGFGGAAPLGAPPQVPSPGMGESSVMGGSSLSSPYGNAPYMGDTMGNAMGEMPSMPPPMPPSDPPPMPPDDDPPSVPGSSLPTMGDRYIVGGGNPNEDDQDNGFLMGGAMGAGLGDPIAAAPAGAPPPPPPA